MVLVGPGSALVVGSDPALLVDAVARVRAAAGSHGVVTPLLLVAGDAAPPDLPAGTLTATGADLVRTVAGCPRLLGPGQVAELQLRLEARLAGTAAPVADPGPPVPLTPVRLALRVLLVLVVVLLVVVLAAVGANVAPRLG